MKTLILPMLILASCSQVENKKSPGVEPVRVTTKDLLTCQEYQKQVLDSSYEAVKKGNSSELKFLQSESQARTSLSNFEVEKSLSKQKAQMVSNILASCDAESIKTFDQDFKTVSGCNLMFSELNYFQALASALKNYRWPTDLKLEGKKVALDYVTHYSQGSFPLLNRLVALSVLDELSVNEVVNKELHAEIKQLMQDSRTYVEGLRSKLDKDPTLSCDSLGIIRDELNYSNQVAAKMQGFLKRI